MKTACMRVARFFVTDLGAGQSWTCKRLPAAGLGWLWLASTGLAGAQTNELPVSAQVEQVADERKAGLWVQPRVSVGLTHTNNSLLRSERPESENTLEVSPGLRAVFNTARVRGDIDYALTGIYHGRGTLEDSIRQSLDAYANVDIWQNRVFLDVVGVVDYQSISAFGTPSVGTVYNDNLTQQKRFLVSPYYRGALTQSIDLDARYTRSTARNDASERSDYTEDGVTFLLRSHRNQDQRLGWTIESGVQTVEYTQERKTTARAVKGELSYEFTPFLRGSSFFGRERNDVLTLDTRSYSSYGVGVDWRILDHTRALFDGEHHYYGNVHNLALEHRSGRTVLRFSDSRNMVGSALDEAVPLMSSDYDLLDSHYLGQESDPIRRAQMVESELERLGFSNTQDLYRRFLTSSSRLERNQQLAILITGLRNVYTIAFGRNKSQRLGADAGSLGDDFDANEFITQRYFGLQYAHRLTPLSAMTVTLSRMGADGSGGVLSESAKVLQIGFTKQFAPRTSCSLRVQRMTVNGSAAYTETSWQGLISHRF